MLMTGLLNTGAVMGSWVTPSACNAVGKKAVSSKLTLRRKTLKRLDHKMALSNERVIFLFIRPPFGKLAFEAVLSLESANDCEKPCTLKAI